MKLVSLKILKSEIDSAIETLECSSSKARVLQENLLAKDPSISLGVLSRCQEWLDASGDKRPTIRVLSHLACSGGTLISKCVGAQPNAYLLSEAHPTTSLNMYEGKPVYSPTDIVKLARFAKTPDILKFETQLFFENVKLLNNHLKSRGGDLIIREHLHADYCVGEKASNSAVIRILKEEFRILRVVTSRHPLDTFLSLENNGWLHFKPKTIHEFCKRYWRFIKEQNSTDIIKYEDFVSQPIKYMKLITDRFELPFNETFIDTFPLIEVTGDSGRSGDVIQSRPRRKFSEVTLQEARESKYYVKICNKLGYNI